MSLRNTATAALLALSVTAPSLANHTAPNPYQDLAQVSSEIDAIQRLAYQVPNPRLRSLLLGRAQNAELALDSAKRSIAPPTYPGRGRPDPGYSRGSDYRAPALSYQDARRIVQREPFDSGRLDAIRRVARTGRFTTQQAASLADLCTFDSSKQQALIALYPAVIDPGRYEMALGILTFPSSRRSVERALNL